jgi:hypothetical protein
LFSERKSGHQFILMSAFSFAFYFQLQAMSKNFAL